MSYACAPILVGVTSPVLEIISKILIDWNRLKKFMQVRNDVTCMHTNFGGGGLFGFGDAATLKNGQISLLTHGL